MKLNKKGFTLIELLAVIVILAIIALIATPMILGVIDKARKGAVESSTLGYIDAIEKEVIFSMVGSSTGSKITAGVYDIAVDTAAGKILADVKVKGEEPTAGWVAIDSQGLIVAASLKFPSYADYVGYTVADRAKAKLGTTGVEKPADKTSSQTMEEYLAAAVTVVSTALAA